MPAAALIASPYAFMYDMAGLMVPAAFLAQDQIGRGWTRGEAVAAVGLFGTALTLLSGLRDMPGEIKFGGTPTGVCAVLGLSGIILRRIARCGEQPAISAGTVARIS